ncbi:MAG: 5-(carboxyamino)imidazole ribonucleotide synthase [Elusimicrobia bacterium]|nr:MAG: 5-(carboxyamino)imidazole ribonucleotide synthase [Elusimicrobiota bacterium]
MRSHGSIVPGSVIGILGGGQLGRMTAMAARSYGYRVQVLDPDPACPARFVVDSCISADFHDARAAAGFARGADVVTLDVEGLSPEVLHAVSAFAPLRPAESILRMIQDRSQQKAWLHAHGFPVAPFLPAHDQSELSQALQALAGPCFVKCARGGYDGRGQFIASGPEDAEAAWLAIGERPCIVESKLQLAHELSVLIARRPSGEQRTFPIALNHHAERVLRWSVLPAPADVVSPALAARIDQLAHDLATTLRLEGLLAIELFLTQRGELFINELAARPHNTFHATERACSSSQFEQHVRAVCDLPLADASLLRPAAIVNLFGDLWLQGGDMQVPPSAALDLTRVLAVPTLRLHLYEKRVPRQGRKMGHLSALGETSEQALSRVLSALELLQPLRPNPQESPAP